MATKDRTSLKNDFANGKYATGEKFADLIDSMKVVQLPVVDPQALGTSLSFIDSISQDEDGKITATKKTLDLANAHELNPFKGWYKTGDTLPTDGFDGAYLYFKDTSEQTGLTTIYRWNGTTYADTGVVVDTSDVHTFASGQAVNGVGIKDLNGGNNPNATGVLSAEAGQALNEKVTYNEENTVLFEYGGIASVDGSLVSGTTRVRSKPIPVDATSGIVTLPYTKAENLISAGSNYNWAYLGETHVKVIAVAFNSDGTLSFTADGTFDNIRISFKHSDNSEISQSELDECKVIMPDIVVPIKDKIAGLENDVNEIKERLDAVEESLSFTESNNIPFEFGSLNENSGSLIDNIIRVRSKPILVDATSGTVTINYTKPNSLTTSTSKSYAYLDETPIGLVPDFAITGTTVTLTADGTFNNIRFTLRHLDNSTISQEELDACEVVMPESIITLKEKVSEIENEIDGLNDKIDEDNPFKGLLYCALGDSITYGYIPRNYTGWPGQLDSYAKLAAQKLEMVFDNQGISGSTLAISNPDSPSTRNPMVLRYTNCPNTADVISVMGGTNDIRNNVPLGTMSDRVGTTYYGALHLILGGLYQKYLIDQGVAVGKHKKIFICTPPKLLASSGNVEGGTGTLVDMSLWCDAIKEVAAYYSIPVLDFQNLSGINPHLNQTIHGTDDGYTAWYNPYITDGTHPTQEGAEMMADVLVGFLKTLK